MNECTVCGQVFGSLKGFDAHRVGKYTMPDSRRCLTEKELLSKGLHQRSNGVWSFPPPTISRVGVKK